MDNANREMKNLKKNKKEMPEIKKKHCREVKDAFGGLIIRLDTAQNKQTNKLEEIFLEIHKAEMQREKEWRKQNWISKNYVTITKGANIHITNVTNVQI